jgi:hypothetical protein
MKKSLIWTIAVIITLGAAVFQRLTGPTNPESYKVNLPDKVIKIHLPTSHGGSSDKKIRIPVSQEMGFIIYRRFPTSEPWDTVVMQNQEGYLTGYLPSQPPAGKLEYLVFIISGSEILQVNNHPVIIRFKGEVPAYALIPHILIIFAAMMFSTVTGFLAAFHFPSYKTFTWITIILLITGGLILGPVIQKFAFGDFWTGFPAGKDLTDNKILVAFILWLIAAVANIKKQRPWLVIVAALVYLVINLIPHSLFGSELDYKSGQVVTGMIPFISLFCWNIKDNWYI